MIQQQTSQPDFIPMDETPDFIPHQASAPQSQSQSYTPFSLSRVAGTFAKQAATTAVRPDLVGGGTVQTDPQLEQQVLANVKKNGMFSIPKTGNSEDGGVGNYLLNTLKSFLPTEQFQSDPSAAVGESAANLLMLRQMLKMKGAPEFGRPAQGAEMVQPLSGYRPASSSQPKALPAGAREMPAGTDTRVSEPYNAPAYSPTTRASRLGLLLGEGGSTGPIELGPSTAVPQTQEGVLPAARKVLRNGNIQYLTRALRPGEVPDTPKAATSMVEQYFIDKNRRALEEPTATGENEQTGIQQRMQELNKAPDTYQTPKYAFRVRDAGSTGVMPNRSAAQASVNPEQVRGYSDYRAQAQNAPQEMVKIDLSQLDPSEYTVHQNGYVTFKSAIPEAFIEKMPSEGTPRVPTSDADMMNLLQQSLQQVRGKAKAAKTGR